MRYALRTLVLGLAVACSAWSALADADLGVTLAGIDARIAAAPGDPVPWQQRAAFERLRGNLEQAAADLSRAEALGLPPAVVERDRGFLLVAAGRSAEAEVVLRNARDREPKDVTILLPHARCLASLGRFRESADTYAALVKLTPDASPDVHLERIRVLEALGPEGYDEALRAADAAITLRGPVPALEQAAIDISLRAGRTELALVRLERMAAATKRPEIHLLQRAGILERAGRLAEAAASYGETLAALESLSPQRRAAPAVAEIEAQARAGIARIAADDEPRKTAAAVQGVAR
jgi:tetratricopeptide (TPR) repeat protein